MNDQNQSAAPPPGGFNESATPAAFCQNCGKPLDKTSARIVGSSVFCEPCLEARLHGTPAGSPFAASAWANTVWPPSGVAPTSPNPGLATLLGFIPGVGAMYNEQYAKGIVHLIVFAVLVSLVNANGIFILFVFGWVFYMAFEAHHTAQARRDGTPLPNPFGLNDIGERFGFGRAWPAAPRYPQPAASTPPPASAGWKDPAAGAASNPEVPGWGAPVDEFTPRRGESDQPQQPGYGQTAYSQVQPEYAAYASDYARNLASNTRREAEASAYAPYPDPSNVPPSGAAMPPYGYGPYTAPPYNATYVPPIPGDPNYIAPPSRFPAGAIWLIGLGTLFLLTTTGIFNGIRGGILVGFLLIGLGIWAFLRRMFDTGGMGDPAAPGYSLRLVRAARGAVWLVLLGFLLLLNDFHILGWHRSWPFFIIAAGVMALLERAAWSNAALGSVPPAYPSPTSATAASSSTSVVPVADRDDHDARKGGR